ncbi:DUF1003 domain-containing protein [Sphingomonas sp. Y38-1Y]|uniref:DUF1003 domain-containing protein n=1 Tax=Sphingomonas sp. Y38-1Y TaxID=3078265 RepID=UPI0028EAF3D4|nr:DUF1003 domain-containing protein [Sphingomonas sp. Y38-1Y]
MSGARGDAVANAAARRAADTPGMTATLAANIARLRERRRAEAERASASERVAAAITGFTGSMTFVVIHLLLFGTWILANTVGLPGIPAFDPSLVVLAMAASVEAIFLSTFVLISQNRMAAAADRRADLDLHIGLLAEHELTRVAALLEAVASQVGVRHDDPEFAEVKRDVEPEKVLDALDEGEA